MDVREFVSSFHNLNGISVDERRKSFSLLLKKIPPDHDTLINSIVPGNYLENLLKLHLLLHLQRVPELIEIFKSEEEYLSLEILKSRWFCHQLTSLLEENTTDFVTNILPHTSFVLRKKLIKKIASLGTNLDAAFDEICKRYGLNFALNLIMGCSAEKIENILQNYRVSLQPFQLKLLSKNHPKLLRIYLNQGYQLDRRSIQHIARHDTEGFLQLVCEFNVKTYLGKSLTKRLLKNFKEMLISNASIFCDSLHLETVMTVLTDLDFKEFYFNSMPYSVDDMLCNRGPTGFYKIRNKLGKLSYPLLFEGMEKVYKKCLYDFPVLVDDEMMQLMDVSERKKWIDIKRKNGYLEHDLIQFMPIEDSITSIKNKINVTSSISERSRLIKLLVKTCIINNDLTALAEIGEYVSSRHSNDNELVLMAFLVEYSFFQLKYLKDRHWKSITEIINILERKNVSSHFLYDFKYKNVEFLFFQNNLLDEQIYDFLKLTKKICKWNFSDENLKLRKFLLLKFITVMPELMENEDRVEDYDLKLINLIFDFNKRCPKDKIHIFDYARLIQSFQNVTELGQLHESPQTSSLLSVFETIVCDSQKSCLWNEVVEKYIALGMNFHSSKINLYLLKHEPEIIVDNLEKILDKTFHNCQMCFKFLKYLKKYTHFKLLEKTINYCLSTIEVSEEQEKLFPALAVLMVPKTYLKLVETFYLATDVIENTKENQKQQNLVIAVIKSFKYVTNNSVISNLLQYCKGDFLQYALECLYSLFHHAPDNKLLSFTEELSSKAVSARKHSLFLICKVGNIEDVKKILEKFIQNEQNVLVQKYLFSTTLNYFIKNPSDQFWEFVKACVNNLDRSDFESFSFLVNLNQIPYKYKVSYTLYVWEVLKCKDLDRYRLKLLSSIPKSSIVDFPLYFLSEVILENFLKVEATHQSVINKFAVFCLDYSNYKDEIMGHIFNNIGVCEAIEHDLLEREKNGRKLISSFVTSLIEHLGSEEKHYAVLCNFSDRWNSRYTVVETLSEHLKLSFTLNYLESVKDMDKFSIAVAEFLDKLVTMYGVAVLDVVSSELQGVLSILFHCSCDVPEEVFRFLLKLLENWRNLSCYILVIKMLPLREPFEEKSTKLYRQIIEILRQVPHESVQILLNVYFTNKM